MFTRDISYFFQPCTVACDGKCNKAWGINQRPRKYLSGDPNEAETSEEWNRRADDFVWCADDELGEAPEDPGTYEGGHGKPSGPHNMNKWCTRECERSVLVDRGAPITLRDFDNPTPNCPSLHPDWPTTR